jgi:hypothetical protein
MAGVKAPPDAVLKTEATQLQEILDGKAEQPQSPGRYVAQTSNIAKPQ